MNTTLTAAPAALPATTALSLAVNILGGILAPTRVALERMGYGATSISTVHRMRRDGNLPVEERLIGRGLYITAEDLAAYLMRIHDKLEPRRGPGRPRKTAG